MKKRIEPRLVEVKKLIEICLEQDAEWVDSTQCLQQPIEEHPLHEFIIRHIEEGRVRVRRSRHHIFLEERDAMQLLASAGVSVPLDRLSYGDNPDDLDLSFIKRLVALQEEGNMSVQHRATLDCPIGPAKVLAEAGKRKEKFQRSFISQTEKHPGWTRIAIVRRMIETKHPSTYIDEEEREQYKERTLDRFAKEVDPRNIPPRGGRPACSFS